jgi:hypothetical protein
MRDYDPTTGRYIQPDPLGLIDGSSVYGYAGQNPGRWTDPRGEQVALPYSPIGGSLGPAGAVAPGTTLNERLSESLINDLFPLLDPRPLLNYCVDSIVTPLGDGTLQCGDQCDAVFSNSKAPGVPGEKEGYAPPKRWDGKKFEIPMALDTDTLTKTGMFGFPLVRVGERTVVRIGMCRDPAADIQTFTLADEIDEAGG